MSEANLPNEAAEVAAKLGARLDARGQQYAVGGAIALGYWGVPRGTVDVDVTVFLPAERPSDCIWLWQELGWSLPQRRPPSRSASTVSAVSCSPDSTFTCSCRWCRCTRPRRSTAQERRTPRPAGCGVGRGIAGRLQADVLPPQGPGRPRADSDDAGRAAFDRPWVREQLVAMYGLRDPRLSAWDELVEAVPAE